MPFVRVIYFEYPRMFFHYSITPTLQYSCGLSRGHAQGGYQSQALWPRIFYICHGG